MSVNESAPFHVHALLLAAGESKRFGTSKQLAHINDQPLILRTLSQLRMANFSSITVALGANAEQVAAVLPNSTDIVIVEHWERGMGYSIAKGVENLPDNTTHLFIGLVDQVEIYAKQCNLLIAQSEENRKKVIASKYQERRGAPAIFPRAFFTELSQLNTDKGARDLLQNNEMVVELELPEAAIDIDTRAELNTYLSTQASSQK